MIGNIPHACYTSSVPGRTRAAHRYPSSSEGGGHTPWHQLSGWMGHLTTTWAYLEEIHSLAVRPTQKREGFLLGTQRVEAMLQSDLRAVMDYHHNDWAVLLAICHRYHDNRKESLSIRFNYLLQACPFRDKPTGARLLKRSLQRLIDAGVISMGPRKGRHFDKMRLTIHIDWWEFNQAMEEKRSSPVTYTPSASHQSKNDFHPNRATHGVSLDELRDTRSVTH